MKKIDIMTFSNSHNYGAVLQAYALQEVLKKENKVEIINYKDKIVNQQYKIIKFNKNIISSILKNILFFNINLKRYLNFKKFIKDNLNMTEQEYKTEKELIDNPPVADIYIAGSDQIWNSYTTQGLKDSYSLNFGSEEIKKISYAASIGNSVIDFSEEKDYKKKLSNLKYISVREENAKDCLEKIIKDKPITVVMDPTLLLTKDEWNKKIIVNKFKALKEKYILAYMVQPDIEYINIVNEIEQKTNLKVVHFSKTNRGIKNVLKSEYTVGPFEFINLIKNAEYVVCTSFHAIVFSIIFNKRFWVIPHRKTGSRVTNLLEKLGISERAVNSLDEFKKMDYDKEIDYKKVNKKLDEERKKSLEWLDNAIKLN